MSTPTLQQKKDAINAFATLMPRIDNLIKRANNDNSNNNFYKYFVELNNAPDNSSLFYKFEMGCTEKQISAAFDGDVKSGIIGIKKIINPNQKSTKNELILYLKTLYSNCQIVLKQLAIDVKKSSKAKNAIGSGGLPTDISEWYSASGTPENKSMWAAASGLPTDSSDWFPASGKYVTPREEIINRGNRNASGSTPRENILNHHFRNSSGSVGAITWNTISGKYEDKDGLEYTLNDDHTFDDGTGHNFNKDGTLAGGKGFFSTVVDIFTSPTTINAATDLAKASINADTKLSADQKAAQIAASGATVKKANSWVLPVTLVGGVIAAGVAYKYFIAKKK